MLDPVIKTLTSQQALSADKELARIQTFLLDTMAPISAILESIDDTCKLGVLKDIFLGPSALG